MSHWQSKTKIRPADKSFSEFVRRRDGKCVYATPRCKNWQDWKDLTCSHFIKRRYEGLRYDEDNCDAACRSCHQWVEDTAEGQVWLEDFKRKQLGETRFTRLLLAKQATGKRDDKMAALVTKQMLQDLLKSQSF